MSNPFETLSERQTTVYTKARLRAAEKRATKAPMKLTEQEQKQVDSGRQVRLYRQWKRAQMRDFRSRYPDGFSQLRRTLRNLTIDNASDLVVWVQSTQWLKALPHADRSLVLSAIDQAIARLRVRNGYPPIDDSLPNEPPTAFELIRAELDCFSMPKDNSWA